jgi:hypothetical protein
LQLDDLSSSIKRGDKRGVLSKYGKSDSDNDSTQEGEGEEEEEGLAPKQHILDDSEQESSDSDIPNEWEDVGEGGEEEESDTEDNPNPDENSTASDAEEQEGHSDTDVPIAPIRSSSPLPSDVYRPTPGEDIYGRKTDEAMGSGQGGGKYIPPALRQKKMDQGSSKEQEKSRGSIALTIDEVGMWCCI